MGAQVAGNYAPTSHTHDYAALSHTHTSLAMTSLTIGSVTLTESTDRAGLLRIADATTTWSGIQIGNNTEDLWSFMADGDNCGLYNDTSNEWHIYCTDNAATDIRFNNSVKLRTANLGVEVTGTLTTTGYIRVGNGTSSDIYMSDSDQGERRIHCNSNRIGFLSQGGGWGAWCDDAGNWVSQNNVTAYSDSRLKTDLKVVKGALSKVLSLSGWTYKRTDKPKRTKRDMGLIAQHVRKAFPQLVLGGPTKKDPDAMYSLNYGSMAAAFVEAIKEFYAEFKESKKKIRSLETRIRRLEKLL